MSVFDATVYLTTFAMILLDIVFWRYTWSKAESHEKSRILLKKDDTWHYNFFYEKRDGLAKRKKMQIIGQLLLKRVSVE